jgi:cell wall-associated NlpC family hydrolase
VKSTTPAGSTIPAVPHGGRGGVALRFALSQLGKPYSYGAIGPEMYDCSGLTQRSWKAAGVSIPRTTQAQASFGSPIALSRIQPGDLVIFYPDASHVGIYFGHGQVVVAPHTGSFVRIEPMRWMPVYDIRRPG